MDFFATPEPDPRPVSEQIRDGLEAMQREWDRGPSCEPSFRVVSPAEYERMKADVLRERS